MEDIFDFDLISKETGIPRENIELYFYYRLEGWNSSISARKAHIYSGEQFTKLTRTKAVRAYNEKYRKRGYGFYAKIIGTTPK